MITNFFDFFKIQKGRILTVFYLDQTCSASHKVKSSHFDFFGFLKKVKVMTLT